MSDAVSDAVEEQDQETERQAEGSAISAGMQLRQARENKHLEQLDVAKELKLDLRFVEALEEGRLNELPQPVYTAGYIRAYSKLVGLSPDEVVAKYTSSDQITKSENSPLKEKEQIPSHYRHVQNTLPKSFSVGHGQSEGNKKLQILVSFLLLAVLLAVGWQLSLKDSEVTAPQTTEVPLQPEVKEEVPADAQTKTDAMDEKVITGEQIKESTGQERETVILPLPAVEPDKKQSTDGQLTESDNLTRDLADNAEKLTELSIHYSEDSWVDIRDATGKAIIRRLGVAGGSNTVSGIAPFEVLLGYSPGVSIERDGERYDLSAYSKKRVARFVLKKDGAVESSRTLLDLSDIKSERSEPFVAAE